VCFKLKTQCLQMQHWKCDNEISNWSQLNKELAILRQRTTCKERFPSVESAARNRACVSELMRNSCVKFWHVDGGCYTKTSHFLVFSVQGRVFITRKRVIQRHVMYERWFWNLTFAPFAGLPWGFMRRIIIVWVGIALYIYWFWSFFTAFHWVLL
jgi:hypothetical protein